MLRLLEFQDTAGFKGYRQVFTRESIGHPAKANLHLLSYLIERYSRVGDWVLDPMSGTASTCILAALKGRNAIGVELEQKFVAMGLANKKELDRLRIVGKGECVVLQGDSRRLSEILSKQVDAIVSSPPYGNRLSDSEVKDGDEARLSYRQALGKVDAIVTSPPYSEQVHSTGQDLAKVVELMREKHYPEEWIKAHYLGPNCQVKSAGYSESPDNVGNLQKESYLSAMKTIYAECHSVLKPNGKLVLILKNFIRNRKLVRLDLDTIQLCESVGFKLVDHYGFKLPQQSFWRVLYYQKNPGVPKIEHEDILVMVKT